MTKRLDRKMTAVQVMELLAAKHAKDVFVPECKSGGTWGGKTEFRMDAWVTNKSWAKARTWVYEVKVSRSDFLGDNKWRNYLQFGSEFYFVCPRGLIAKDELPPEAGLIYASGPGGRLTTVKKAPARDVTPPEDLFRYILMNRIGGITRAAGEPISALERAKEYQRWVVDKRLRKMIGQQVGGAVAEVHRDLMSRNSRLETHRKLTQTLAKRLREMGIDPETSVNHWGAKNAIDRHLGKADAGALRAAVRQVRHALDNLDKAAGSPAGRAGGAG